MTEAAGQRGASFLVRFSTFEDTRPTGADPVSDDRRTGGSRALSFSGPVALGPGDETHTRPVAPDPVSRTVRFAAALDPAEAA